MHDQQGYVKPETLKTLGSSFDTVLIVGSFPSSVNAEGQTAIREDLISMSTPAALIERYFNPEASSEALADPDNNECLIRPKYRGTC